ncbi:MAG TPA: M2 family metallopeptidase [Candidatus Saccharimonadales bacterium]|nr:M2 family metallopeptidase [Candidatus Saccharimonadales bacterium]
MNGRLVLRLLAVGILLTLAGAAVAAPADSVKSALQERADRFLDLVNAGYQGLYTVAQRAQWDAATDVTPEHDAASAAASKAQAAFLGNPALINECKALLEHESELAPLTVRELRRALLNAAEGPMTNPALVSARIDAETKQASIMNSFEFKLNGKPISANDIDNQLASLTDVQQRLAVWETSKQSGPALKPGLVQLQGLRNGVARELGYPDYFALEVASHDMTTAEMLKMHEDFLRELRPLYVQLYTWAKYELAKKYHQPVPAGRIPAHWIPNRWSQEWEAMVEVPDLDAAFKGRTAEWVVKTAEAFYTSIGRKPLPESFWKSSDLYPVQVTDKRKKNTHASCWDIDLDGDVRSLMSVEANEEWFTTAHHELGHGYYDFAYHRPEVPMLLRTGASPAFHEGFATVAELASRQTPYRQMVGLLPPGKPKDDITPLLRDALSTVPFMFWCSGVMTHWEADVYAHELPADQWNARWWKYVAEFQGIDPPSPRGEEFCDAATKTHINDNPAYYYSYAMATVFAYQLHDHIARVVLKQDPRNCNYAGHPEVGAFLESMQKYGAAKDWRAILREATGEDLSTRAMVAYYQPLMKWLEKQNRGRKLGWE